jgi:hypothetical protein
MDLVTTIAIVALGVACFALYLSWSTGKVIEQTKKVLEDTQKIINDMKGVLIGAQVHSMALGLSIDQLTVNTQRVGPPTFGKLPFTSYNEYLKAAAKAIGLDTEEKTV